MPSSKAIDPEPKPEKQFTSAINSKNEPNRENRPMYTSSKQ